MFKTKAEFKKEFAHRMLMRYGVSVEESHVSEQYNILGEMVRDFANVDCSLSHHRTVDKNEKTLIYFSMEFLIGRLLVNNMQNMGIYEIARDGLKDLGINIHELEEQESDAGLGNGGLGRLAACFLDSIASLGYLGHGNCIRYQYGFFKQRIVDGKQKELPDQWLTNGNVWEVRRNKYAVEVKFGGTPETYIKEDGTYGMRTRDAVCVRAVPFDVPVVGYRNNVTNSLRLWNAEPSDKNLPKHTSFDVCFFVVIFKRDLKPHLANLFSCKHLHNDLLSLPPFCDFLSYIWFIPSAIVLCTIAFKLTNFA